MMSELNEELPVSVDQTVRATGPGTSIVLPQPPPTAQVGHHGFRVSSPLEFQLHNPLSSMSSCKCAISLSRPPNSGLGPIPNHTCHGATFLHCQLYLHLYVSLLLDTRRGVETLCRRPFTVISNKTATSSNPGTVRDYYVAKAPREF